MHYRKCQTIKNSKKNKNKNLKNTKILQKKKKYVKNRKKKKKQTVFLLLVEGELKAIDFSFFLFSLFTKS